MKFVKMIDGNRSSISSTSFVTEYPLEDSTISAATAQIRGRYPEEGFVVNENCRELVFVTGGSGRIAFRNGDVAELSQGDVLLILPNEEYFWEGDLEAFLPCCPPWNPDQHKVVQ